MSFYWQSPYKFHEDMTGPPDRANKPFIFVFGSNLAGRHGAGAALEACNRYGAILGRGVGPMGRSYAIPTKDKQLRRLSVAEITQHIQNFLCFADARKENGFWVTRIGCGLAGYEDKQIAPLFKGAPKNCNFANEWKNWL